MQATLTTFLRPVCRVLAVAIDAAAGCIVSASRRGEGGSGGGGVRSDPPCLDVPYLARLAVVVGELALYPGLFNGAGVADVRELHCQLLHRCGDMRVGVHRVLHGALSRAALQMTAQLPRAVAAEVVVGLLLPQAAWDPSAATVATTSTGGSGGGDSVGGGSAAATTATPRSQGPRGGVPASTAPGGGGSSSSSSAVGVLVLPPLLSGTASTAGGLLHCLAGVDWNSGGSSSNSSTGAVIRAAAPPGSGNSLSAEAAGTTGGSGAGEGGALSAWGTPGQLGAFLSTVQTLFFDNPVVAARTPAAMGSSTGGGAGAGVAHTPTGARGGGSAAHTPKQSLAAVEEVVAFLVQLTKTGGGARLSIALVHLPPSPAATLSPSSTSSSSPSGSSSGIAGRTANSFVRDVITATLQGMQLAQGAASPAAVKPQSVPGSRQQHWSGTLPAPTAVGVGAGAPSSSSPSPPSAAITASDAAAAARQAVGELDALFAPLAAPGLISTGPAGKEEGVGGNCSSGECACSNPVCVTCTGGPSICFSLRVREKERAWSLICYE